VGERDIIESRQRQCRHLIGSRDGNVSEIRDREVDATGKLEDRGKSIAGEEPRDKDKGDSCGGDATTRSMSECCRRGRGP
jgi:hypothetical protein